MIVKSISDIKFDALEIGYIPLVDSAPLIMAKHWGLFSQFGLDVSLRPVRSWAQMRDLLGRGAIDAASMLAPMVVASGLGVEPSATDFMTALSLNLGGNAITVSSDLYADMCKATPGLEKQSMIGAEALLPILKSGKREAPLVFASVYPYSSHNYQLRYWLEKGGIHPDRDVRLVVLPPPQLPDALARGDVDGYCVGEPWNVVAIDRGVGVCVVTASELLGRAPEKVLAVRGKWADENPDIHNLLVSAVLTACTKLGTLEALKETAKILSLPAHFDLPQSLLEMTLTGQSRPLANGEKIDVPEFLTFSGDEVNSPRVADALWFAECIMRLEKLKGQVDAKAICKRVYREADYTKISSSL